jgi:hypothetical protein
VSSRDSGAAVRLNPESILRSIETALWILRCAIAHHRSTLRIASQRSVVPAKAGIHNGSCFACPGRREIKHTSAFPRHDRARVFATSLTLANREGAGNAGARAEPAALRAKVKSTQASHHRSAERSGIPCAMVLRFPSCSPRRPGLLSPSSAQCASIVADLISASGYQAHTTSPSAWRPSSRAQQRPSRPAPNVRDDRETPLLRGAGCAERCF